MHAQYQKKEKEFDIYEKKPFHVRPHIHRALECIYVTKGCVELGVGPELYHLEAGDFGIVFPDIIHHYQVFSADQSSVIYLLCDPSLCGSYFNQLQQFCPEFPVLTTEKVHEDIPYVMKQLLKEEDTLDPMIRQSYLQLLLGRCLPQFTLTDKSNFGSDDIIYRAVVYIAGHFTENITLTSMAKDLYVSPYALSRIFSGTFHSNFNRYLNDTRLQYAVRLLRDSDLSITDICLEAGFESQRTFNRVFQSTYHMSPREYKKTLVAEK